MAGYEFQCWQILAEELCSALRAILMTDSVKSVTTNPLFEPFIRARIYSGRFRQPAVKAGVEHSHLKNCPDTFLDDFDPLQLGAIMEWREDGHPRYRRFHFWCDGRCRDEVLSTVNDAMTYYVDFGRRGHGAHLSVP